MRFVYGTVCGALAMTVFATTVCNAWFAPSVDHYPEFREACAARIAAETEGDRLRRQLAELDLDTIRRANRRDPVNPAGKVVPAEDRIPVPAVPFPVTPVVPVPK